MKLYFSKTSPFARKVRLAALILGLDKEIELEIVDVFKDPHFKEINPLVKIPTLKTRDGFLLSNSPVIVDYLDSLSTTKKVIPADGSRWQALQFQSIADGVMDASVLRRLESLRPSEKQDHGFDSRQKEKIKNGLAYFESHIRLLKEPWGIAEISAVSMLGYLELRFAHEGWLSEFPQLQNWAKRANETEFAKGTHFLG